MVNPNLEKIELLESKIDLLVSHYRGLKSEIRLLQDEKDRLLYQLEESTKSFNDLEKSYENLKLTKSLISPNGDTTETKKKINQIVREIDKCIALLNQ